MKLTITIENTDNTAFGDNDWDRAQDISRIVRRAAHICEQQEVLNVPIDIPLLDSAGNKVGSIVVSE